MAKQQFGTDTITGLNVGTAPHKIRPDELQVSEDGWTDREGAWRTAKGPTTLYSGYDDISCFAAGRMNGADHRVWMDGDTVYDNGSNVGTITAGSSMRIIALDDKFLILGAAKNYLYDGDHVREHGAWQPGYMSCSCSSWETDPTGWTAITGISEASPCVVTTAGHARIVGDRAYISGTDMTEINDRHFYVTAVTATTMTLDVDSSGYTTWTTGGYVDVRAGLEGVYSWYLTSVIELSSGKVLESRPRGIRIDAGSADGAFAPVDYPEFEPDDTWAATELSLSVTDYVRIGIDWGTNSNDWKLFLEHDSVSQYVISGTQGTDWIPGLRLYRTKADADIEAGIYLEREFWQGDDEVSTFSDATGAGIKLSTTHAGKPDIDLGAVYTASSTDHSAPPVSDLAVTVGQRLFTNNTAEPDQYHWSHTGGIEYYNPLGWNTVPDTIAGLAMLNDALVIWSQDRLWVDFFTGGLPDLHEIRTDVGTTWGAAIATIDDGAAFLRDDGLWLFDGAQVVCISRRGFSELTTPTSIAAAGDTIYLAGANDSFVIRQRDSGMTWHSSGDVYPLVSATGGTIYGASTHAIVSMFTGEYRGGSLRTADFSAGRVVNVEKVILDIEGDTIPTVLVNGNRQGDEILHSAESTDADGSRRRVWIPIPLISNHIFSVDVAATGDLTVYGVWVEVT